MSIWLSPGAWTATDWAGVQAVVLAIQAVVLAIAAWIAIRQLREARVLRESQARPFVVVDLDVEPAQQAIYIVITNTGNTIARNVKVTFEPELESSFDLHGRPGLIRDLKPLREGMGTLPPGKRVKVLFDIFTSREEGTFPDVYRAQVRFDAPALKKESLEETYELDLGLYRNVLHINRADVHDVNKQLEKLVKAVERLGGSGSAPLARRADSR